MSDSIKILYEDNHIIAAVKPCNMPIQADSSKDKDMLTILKEYIKQKYSKPGNVYLGLVHRLDRPVGGVMVFAKTSKAASRLCEGFAEHRFDKRYVAVLCGSLKTELRLENYLLANDNNVKAVSKDTPGAKMAALETRPISVKDGLTLCEVKLETGRKHQIRVQHAAAGYPLWGDNRYGSGKPGMQIALWAYSLTIIHPTLKTQLTFSALPVGGIWQTFKHEIELMETVK